MLSALWGIVGLLALATLFVTYTNFPNYFNLSFIGWETDMRMDRHGFFYTFAGLFLVLNLITYVGLRSTKSLNASYQLYDGNQHLRLTVSIKTLVIGANLFLLTLTAYSRAAIEAQSLTGVYHWSILLIGPVIMLLGLIYLLYVLLYPIQSAR